jgi:hypothetical protein
MHIQSTAGRIQGGEPQAKRGWARAPVGARSRSSSRRFAALGATLSALVLGALLASSPAMAQSPPTCTNNGPNGSLFVTPDCTDPAYNSSTFVTDSVMTGTTAVNGQSVTYTQVLGHFPAYDVVAKTAVGFWFPAKIQVPPGSGEVINKVEWEFNTGSAGTGAAWQTVPEPILPRLNVTNTYTFTTPGTYYLAVRLSTQPAGAPATGALIQGLAQAAVIVR